VAFPAANGTTFPLSLADAWTGARNAAANIKLTCTNVLASIAAGPVSAQAIAALPGALTALNTQLTTYAAVPGIAAYAQAQVNNSSLDVAGSFTAMQSALAATISWIVANFPKDGSNNLLCLQFNGSNQPVYTTFTQAQLAGLQTQLTALSATIS
jgi:hypothetical protein